MNKKLKNTLQIILSLCLGGFFIWIFVRKLTIDEINEIWAGFARANYWWVIASVFVGLLSHWARAQRWKLLLEPMGYHPSSINMFGAVLVAYLTNLALPRVGEITRCSVLLKQEKIPFSNSFGTVVTERVFDLFCFFLFFLLFLIFQFSNIKDYIYERLYIPLSKSFSITSDSAVTKIVVIASIVVLIVILLFIYRRIRHTKFGQKIKNVFKGFGDGLKSLTKLKRPFRFVLYTLLMWTCYLFMGYLVFFSFPETSNLSLAPGFAILLLGTIGIAIVQGGIGIYPVIVSETLSIWGIPAISGYTVGWLIWSIQQVTIIVFGLATILFLPMLNRCCHEKSSNN